MMYDHLIPSFTAAWTATPGGIRLAVENIGKTIPARMLTHLDPAGASGRSTTPTRTPEGRRNLGLGLYVVRKNAAAIGDDRVTSNSEHASAFPAAIARGKQASHSSY